MIKIHSLKVICNFPRKSSEPTLDSHSWIHCFSKVFNTFSHNVLASKLGHCSLDGQKTRWEKPGWDDHPDRSRESYVVLWMPATSGVPSGTNFWTHPVGHFIINYLDKATRCPFVKLEDNRRLQRGGPIQRHPGRLEWQADRSLTKSSEDEFKAWPWERRCPCSDTAGDRLSGELPCGKGPGDPGGQKAECEALTADSQQCLRLWKQEYSKEIERSDCSLDHAYNVLFCNRKDADELEQTE